MKTCYNCSRSLVRAKVKTEKFYGYEACELGLIPMQPTLPIADMSQCPGWASGVEAEIQYSKIDFGPDWELFDE